MDVGGPINLEGIQEDYRGGWVILWLPCPLTCTGIEEAGICPFTNTCCGTLWVEWPLWGQHLLSWPFLVPIPTHREWLLLMGGISSPNETSSCEHVLA